MSVVEQQENLSVHSSHSSTHSSYLELNELSEFGARKHHRLPVLIKSNQNLSNTDQPSSQPATATSMQHQASGKANSLPEMQTTEQQDQSPAPVNSPSGDFQMLDASEVAMDAKQQQQQQHQQQQASDELNNASVLTTATNEDELKAARKAALASLGPQMTSASLVGDSLIEMVINLRNENESLVRALEINNQFVKQRLAEFKQAQQEAARREVEFASQRAEFESVERKLTRQNSVLSERLKVMEAKLRDLRLEVNDTLDAARSSRLNSLNSNANELYPKLPPLDNGNGNGNSSSQPLASAEQQRRNLDSNDDQHSMSDDNSSDSDDSDDHNSDDHKQADTLKIPPQPANVPFGAGARQAHVAAQNSASADNATLDPMAQCDQLERQLSELGRRDYEICLLQQQLNIYRQDFRLERMQKLDAKLQIEKLKADIDRLCLERVRATTGQQAPQHLPSSTAGGAARQFASETVGRLGAKLQRRAMRTAARAAKYASKQAHLEEKLAARMAAATTGAKPAAPPAHSQDPQAADSSGDHHKHRAATRHGGRRASRGPRLAGVGSEIVGDLMQTANKAMLTGYKLTSTHVNLALDKLAEFEQSQASKLHEKQL